MRRSRTMDEPTTMSSTGQGLVQKVFFPSYLDAGFDESFTSSSSLKKSASRSNTPNSSSVVLDRSITESVGSEASTAIRDNRSNSSMLVANRKKKHSQQQAMVLHGHKPNPPSFFASTKPTAPQAVKATPETENQHTHPHHPFLPIPPSPVSDPPPLLAPTSPPKVARTHSGRKIPTPSRFPFDMSNHLNGVDDSLDSFKDASSIAIVSSLNGRNPIVLSNENKYEDGIESDASSCLSHPPPTSLSMFDDTTDDYDDQNQQEPQPRWEEEATPAQTAFGKRLLFQRVLRTQNSGDTDDVLSTASENGSLVDYDRTDSTGRVDEDVNRNKHNASQESGGSAESSQYATPLQDEYSAPLWDDKTLHLPILEVPVESAYREVVPTDKVTQDRDLEEKKVPDVDERGSRHTSGGATGLLSMAIRRLGSGLTNTNYNGSNHLIRNKCMSAPTTPRASSFGPNYFFNDPVIPSPKQPQLPSPTRRVIPTKLSSSLSQSGQHQEGSLFPSSFLLRSPGSLVFQEATRDRIAQGNPRINQNHCRTIFNKIPENEEASRDDNASRVRQSNSAFQIARSCFSFDAYDTSVNEQYDVDIPQYNLVDSMLQHPPNEVQERESGRSPNQRLYTSRPHLQTSASWDLGYSPDIRKSHRDYVVPFQPQRGRDAFRPRSSHTRVPFPSPNQPTTSCSVSPSRKGVHALTTSNFSPSSVFGANVTSNTQELKSPQRIEIERDDALDILACLVERGVSWKQEDVFKREEGIANSENPSITTTDQDSTSNVETDRPSPSVLDISAVVKELQDLSLAEEKLGDFHSNSEAHQKRKMALEELLRSHEYALEMKRASQSASFWLKSIGRSQSSSPTKSLSPARNVILSEETSVTDSLAQVETSETETSSTSRQAAGEESSASDNIDLLTAKAMLHSMQMEVKEKSELADRLNEELAKCRAEIGRLKSSAQASVSFRSPNRSILDESDDISVTEGDDEDEEVHVLDRVVDESDCVLDSSFLREGDCADETEVVRLKTSLDEAISIIRTLYAALNDTGEDLEYTSALKERIESVSRNHLHKTFEDVNSTDFAVINHVPVWIDLDLPLTHPPDHGLRSPIVTAVLESWTNDLNLQESLLSWFDDVLDGGDSDSIPPLTLSSLESQVRDGFVLHVLPLLCRRSDLRIDVRTRSQRTTTYDLSISIDGTTHIETSNLMHSIQQQPESTSAMSDIGLGTTESTDLLNTVDQVLQSVHSERCSHLNSLDDISPMARDSMLSRLSHDEMTEEIPSLDEAQPGIMSALGGALGGLLSRRKGVLANYEAITSSGPQSSMQTILESPASVGLVHEIVGLVSETDGDDQPYHRVVSAPPGRIGVTFVEYRGHCMVSDVHPDSPLVSWIFPSDVLIAVDNLPVSGMKVRDIVKVLQDRTLAQRALRVISSHAMSEFTLNASLVADEAG